MPQLFGFPALAVLYLHPLLEQALPQQERDFAVQEQHALVGQGLKVQRELPPH